MILLTERDISNLKWLLDSEIKVQEQLLDYSDGTLITELKFLRDKFEV